MLGREASSRKPGRRTSLAWSNLTYALIRTVVSVGGIGFAIILMFMQLGFLGSVGDTAVLVLNRLPGDLVVRSLNYISVFDSEAVPDHVLAAVQSVPEVQDVRPLDLGLTQWQNPRNGEFRAIAVMGIDLDNPSLNLSELTPSTLSNLRRIGTALIDDASSADFGPTNGRAFGPGDIGLTADVVGQTVEIVGTFQLGTGLAANGAILVSRQTFARLIADPGRRSVSLAVVRLKPSITPEAGAASVTARLSQMSGPISQADVLTLDQAKNDERWHWYLGTPVGMIFGIGVLLAVVVGGVISYMVLAFDVMAHLPEYATLKAMGYTNGYLVKTLLAQSTYLAVMAFPPSYVVALGLYRVTAAASGLPIRMTTMWLVLVFALTMLMCGTAGVFALRKLLKAEPANLF